MLALICRVGQSIQIGPDIRLTVQARLGVRAWLARLGHRRHCETGRSRSRGQA